MPAVVFCDVDGVLRKGKGVAVTPEIQREIALFRGDGGIFNMITGAPLAHVPDIPAHMVFAETGGVKVMGGVKYVFAQGQRSVRALRQRLGILQEDGVVKTPYGTVVVEGRRDTSLTLLFGSPPHYPGCVTSADMDEVNAWIGESAQELSLTLSIGHDTTYSYSDVLSLTKREAVSAAMREAGWDRAYFLGDKYPDFVAMTLSEIVPVGFANSIEEIQLLAEAKGIYIDLPGPEGGVVEFFRRLKSGKI